MAAAHYEFQWDNPHISDVRREILTDFLPKIKLEILAEDSKAEAIVDTITFSGPGTFRTKFRDARTVADNI